MTCLIQNILTEEECKYLTIQFDIEKQSKGSHDDETYGNSYGFRPSHTFNLYLDTLKEKILNFFPENTILENVNTYVREYLNNSQLVKHTDRKDIDITISICLEYNIKTDWPLWAEIDGEDVFLNMNVGDGVLLTTAHETTHWRDKLICDENERVVQLFLHWRSQKYTPKKIKTLL
jgi:hypothetical protein